MKPAAIADESEASNFWRYSLQPPEVVAVVHRRWPGSGPLLDIGAVEQRNHSETREDQEGLTPVKRRRKPKQPDNSAEQQLHDYVAGPYRFAP